MSFCFAFFSINVYSQQHPNLILSSKGVKDIKQNLGKVPLFDKTLANAILDVESLMRDGVLVPVPKDLAGGYTHEVHKRNFLELYKAGVLYQILDDEKYAQFTKDVLMAYADLYPTLEKHPSDKSYAPGKIFWQCLNDANWLVYMSQAYDAIYNYLNIEEREKLEEQLFRPFADYISKENPRFFNRIHNHSTWGNAAVGMIALVMNDDKLLDRALFGLRDQLKTAVNELDNDGGLINKSDQQEAGFYAQLNHSFSPDGYYTEGPYYQRYAMSPFIFFAQALHNVKPELKIFKHKDGILKKAVYTVLHLSDSEGQFFPINDAQKNMSYKSRELIASVDIIYNINKDQNLLSVVQDQNLVQLDQTGLYVATDLLNEEISDFIKPSKTFSDGPNGKRGGLTVLRTTQNDDKLSCLFKYSAQGMGHGHFDRLSYAFYNNDNEVLQDYGAARWVNIDQKAGGRYLKENKTWAKQSIAHNTIVVDEVSHFKGNTQAGEKSTSEHYFSNLENSKYQITSAKDFNAYEDTELHRTLCLINDPDLYPNAIMLDVFKINGNSEHQYDLPFHFKDHFLEASFEFESNLNTLKPLGRANGYQHVWHEGTANLAKGQYHFSWMSDNRIYTMHALSENYDQMLFGRIGANDPNFNLRRDAFLTQRRKTVSPTFVSVINAHGLYSPVSEIPLSPYAKEIHIRKRMDTQEYTVVELSFESGLSGILFQNNINNDNNKMNSVEIDGKEYIWKGPITFKIIKR